MCQYCEFKTEKIEKGAKAFITEKENKVRVYIEPLSKIDTDNIFITAEIKNIKKSIMIYFCPFCGRKVRKGAVMGVQEKRLEDGSIIQSMRVKDNKIMR